MLKTLGLAGCYEFSYELKGIRNSSDTEQWVRDQLARFLVKAESTEPKRDGRIY